MNALKAVMVWFSAGQLICFKMAGGEVGLRNEAGVSDLYLCCLCSSVADPFLLADAKNHLHCSASNQHAGSSFADSSDWDRWIVTRYRD
jgi:hypothetical protein